MAGDISFLQHTWMGSGSAVQFVMEFLADHIGDGPTRDDLRDMIAGGVAFLYLEDPAKAELVDLIADALPSYIEQIDDIELRDALREGYADLLLYAREQQKYNRNPGQQTHYTIGPSPAKYFHLNTLASSVNRRLTKVDYVHIDVSDYAAEQRAIVRDYVAELANPHVLIVGDG